jgi:hypothetical protein
VGDLVVGWAGLAAVANSKSGVYRRARSRRERTVQPQPAVARAAQQAASFRVSVDGREGFAPREAMTPATVGGHDWEAVTNALEESPSREPAATALRALEGGGGAAV